MDDRKILLLNQDYKVINFVSEKKALTYLFKDKVEVISYWEDSHKFKFMDKKIKQPSIIRLKYFVKVNGFKNLSFSKRFLAKRDRFTCQYCLKKLSPTQLTIDHVTPQSRGGKTTYTNCVISCWECNNKKDCKTPLEANMKLHSIPIIPKYIPITMLVDRPLDWNQEWDNFFRDECEYEY